MNMILKFDERRVSCAVLRRAAVALALAAICVLSSVQAAAGDAAPPAKGVRLMEIINCSLPYDDTPVSTISIEVGVCQPLFNKQMFVIGQCTPERGLVQYYQDEKCTTLLMQDWMYPDVGCDFNFMYWLGPKFTCGEKKFPEQGL